MHEVVTTATSLTGVGAVALPAPRNAACAATRGCVQAYPATAFDLVSAGCPGDTA
jgi:hypothetical protein